MRVELSDDELLATGLGLYSHLKTFKDGRRACVARMAYTCAILAGLDAWGHDDRWCYQTAADARRALDEWDGTGEPQGWHRHPATGRRVDKATGREYVMP